MAVSCEQIIADHRRPAMALNDSLSPSPRSRFAMWQRAYQAVLAESDPYTLFKLVEIAEAAVLTCRAALDGNADGHSERQALEEALSNLRAVKRERLNFQSEMRAD
jgi:hypothetical protein